MIAVGRALLQFQQRGLNMNLPIQFPSDVEVIREEVKRFRSLTPRERARSIRSVINAGARLIAVSPKSAFLAKYAAEQEQLAREAFIKNVARYATDH